MLTFTPFFFGTLMLIVLGCVGADCLRRRKPAGALPLTVVVPCFNDGKTVAATLRSIFAAYPDDLLEVIAINDASSDESLREIEGIAREFPITVVNNRMNTGKAESLNRAIRSAKHEQVLCLDADTLLNRTALNDLLSRLIHRPRVGAVSCPYKPLNGGFLPAMQAIEYSMLRLSQGAGNVTSALALWGGCLMVKKSAFLEAGGFSLNAITEDVDLAFKLNRCGWKVEQSFVFVQTEVPSRWKSWVRQKIRWTSGGCQCFFRYPGVWLRNPLQMLFIFSYTALTFAGLHGLTANTSLFNILEQVAALVESDLPLDTVWQITQAAYGPVLLTHLLTGAGFSLFSLVYVLPTISRIRDGLRLMLIIPFSLGYFPLYLLVSLVGFSFWFIKLRQTPQEERAW